MKPKKKIKNLKKAAKRIKKAIKNKENIFILADSDLDGVCSAIILEETIKNLGGAITSLYFPDRENEGYGFTKSALENFKKYKTGLIITLDCGISNFKEIELANKFGFEIIIIDHHEILDRVPKASIIVNPKQEGDDPFWKNLANVGLTYHLCLSLMGKKISPALNKVFLELTAIATIADMVPKEEENKNLIIKGLSEIESTWQPGLRALFGLKKLKDLNLMAKIYKINSMLNIRKTENKLPFSYRILTITDKKQAEKIAELLFKKHLERKNKINEIIEEINNRIYKKKSEPIVFEGDEKWDNAYLGVVASVISKKHKKPVFLYRLNKREIQVCIRAVSGYNLVEGLKFCQKELISYGGHPKAAGCRLKTENLKNFKKCLFDYYSN